MTWTWAEPFAGAAACALRLVGGERLKPPVAWMGGKRRYARAILDAMGVPEGPPSRVLLADAGPWGWVWPLLLRPADAARVATVLRSWAGEHHGVLWDRIKASPPADNIHERAAGWLWLQARAASGVPLWWSGERWEQGSGEGRPPQPAGQRGQWLQCRSHGSSTHGAVQAASQKGTARGRTGGMVNPATIAARIEALAEAFARVDWLVHHADARTLPPPRRSRWPAGGVFAYLDPPYRGATRLRVGHRSREAPAPRPAVGRRRRRRGGQRGRAARSARLAPPRAHARGRQARVLDALPRAGARARSPGLAFRGGRMTQRTPCPEPERLPVDPEVAVAAFRFPSRSAPGRTYDAALLWGEDCGEPVTYWDCTCWPFLKVDRCQHVDRARVLLANEERAEDRQAQLDARLGCRHPLTVDLEPTEEDDGYQVVVSQARLCLGCGSFYDRALALRQLREAIRERHRLPSSPWTPGERAEDCDL